RFLVERKDRPTFLAFVRQGMADGWDRAARRHYGAAGVEELERQWLESLRLPMPRDEAVPAPPAPPPVPTQRGVAAGLEPGVVRVRWPWTQVEPVTTYRMMESNAGKYYEPVTTFRSRSGETTERYSLDVVKVVGLDGKELGRDQIARRLKKETALILTREGEE